MRVLVTGTSGHVGAAVARHLLAGGHEVVGLSRRPATVAGLAGELLHDLGGASPLVADLGATARCAAIVHAAAVRDTGLTAQSVVLSNCLGTQRVLELAEAWDVAKVVFLSGVTVIGAPLRLPVDEDHPARPATAYHASKLFGEQLMAIAAAGGRPTASLRLTAPVGPGIPPGRLLTVLVARALAGEPLLLAGTGSRRQDYVDVRDVAAAVERCLLTAATGTINVGGGTTTSNLELACACVELLGSSSEIRPSGAPDPDDAVTWEVSLRRAAELLGYAPRHGVADAILAAAAEHRPGT